MRESASRKGLGARVGIDELVGLALVVRMAVTVNLGPTSHLLWHYILHPRRSGTRTVFATKRTH